METNIVAITEVGSDWVNYCNNQDGTTYSTHVKYFPHVRPGQIWEVVTDDYGIFPTGKIVSTRMISPLGQSAKMGEK